jgi:hypothetical protein
LMVVKYCLSRPTPPFVSAAHEKNVHVNRISFIDMSSCLVRLSCRKYPAFFFESSVLGFHFSSFNMGSKTASTSFTVSPGDDL